VYFIQRESSAPATHRRLLRRRRVHGQHLVGEDRAPQGRLRQARRAAHRFPRREAGAAAAEDGGEGLTALFIDFGRFYIKNISQFITISFSFFLKNPYILKFEFKPNFIQYFRYSQNSYKPVWSDFTIPWLRRHSAGHALPYLRS
jgi:hypothetical protein